jgi:hypothetical protein
MPVKGLRMVGQIDRVLATIQQPPVEDGAQGGQQLRLAPGRSPVGGHGRRLAPDQPLDVLHGIEAAPGVARVRPRRDPPAAHVGIQRLGLDPQPLQRLAPSDPASFAVHDVSAARPTRFVPHRHDGVS